MLHIRVFSEEDLGSYEFQINTSPVKINVLKIRKSKRKDIHYTACFGGVPSNITCRPPKLELPENSGSITSIIGYPDIYFFLGPWSTSAAWSPPCSILSNYSGIMMEKSLVNILHGVASALSGIWG